MIFCSNRTSFSDFGLLSFYQSSELNNQAVLRPHQRLSSVFLQGSIVILPVLNERPALNILYTKILIRKTQYSFTKFIVHHFTQNINYFCGFQLHSKLYFLPLIITDIKYIGSFLCCYTLSLMIQVSQYKLCFFINALEFLYFIFLTVLDLYVFELY